MINRFNKPASTKVRDFTQETDAQLAYRLQNEEFRNLYHDKNTTRNPTQTPTQNLPANDDLTEIVVDGASEIRNRELTDHEYALNLQKQYSREAQLNNQRTNFTSVQDELALNLQIEQKPKQSSRNSHDQSSVHQKSNKSSESRSSVESDERIAKKLQNKEIRRAQRDLKKLAEQEDLAALEKQNSKSTPPTEDELAALKIHRQQLLAENARIASDKNQIIQRIHDDRRNENKNRKHRAETGRVSPSAVSMDPRALDYDIQEIDRREREVARQRMELEKEVNRAHELNQKKHQVQKTHRQTCNDNNTSKNNTNKQRQNEKCKIQ